MTNYITTSKAYFQGYRIQGHITGINYLAEKVGSEWKLYALDNTGDVYGSKEWHITVDTLTACKAEVEYSERQAEARIETVRAEASEPCTDGSDIFMDPADEYANLLYLRGFSAEEFEEAHPALSQVEYGMKVIRFLNTLITVKGARSTSQEAAEVEAVPTHQEAEKDAQEASEELAEVFTESVENLGSLATIYLKEEGKEPQGAYELIEHYMRAGRLVDLGHGQYRLTTRTVIEVEQEDMSYSGWTNYETWRVNLEWVEDMEFDYEVDGYSLQHMISEVIAANLSEANYGIIDWMWQETLDRVNWDEIAETVNAKLEDLSAKPYSENLDTYCQLYVAAYEATDGYMHEGVEADDFMAFKQRILRAFDESYLDELEEDLSERKMRLSA